MKLAFVQVVALLIALMANTASASHISIYYNDFDGSPNFSAGVIGGFTGVTSTESVQGYSGLGNGTNVFAGSFLRNDSPDRPNINPHQGTAPTPALPTILTLGGLPAHTSLDVNFLFALIDSWDGLGTPTFSPDIFNVEVDGVLIFSEYMSEIPSLPSRAQSYVAPANGLLAVNTQLGFTDTHDGAFTDAAYDMYLERAFKNIPHSASSVTIRWYSSGSGWEGGISESWGLDNAEIRLGGVVPEPSSLVLTSLALGIFGIGGTVKRTRTKV